MTGAEASAAAVARIRLLGAPRTVLVDPGSLGARGSRSGDAVRRLLAALGLDVVTLPLGGLSITGPVVAILSRPHAPVLSCYAWYVGPGGVPGWMHPTGGGGPATTRRILELLGTGLAQERAGAAFRAAGAGRATPRSARYDAAGTWAGITAAVAPAATPHAPAATRYAPAATRYAPAATPFARAAPSPRPGRPEPDPARRRREVLRRSAGALDRCCAATGAIAAAPPARPGEPDYWFFWQRDAACVALALGALAGCGAGLAAWARGRVRGYLDFVAALGPGLGRHPGGAGFARCSMSGGPVAGYGDPQPDGPAATALAVLSLAADPREALRVAGPFLDHLAGGGARRAGFDLWELTVGWSFHAVNLARRALRAGAGVAAAAADPAAARYREEAARYAGMLPAFQDPAGGHFVHVLGPLPPWFAATSRLDASVVGSALLGYDADDEVLNVEDPRLAATMAGLAEHFARRWPVNAAWQAAGRPGLGIGRFPEDCNDGVGSAGGNPWPVATLWAAQYHARRVPRLLRLGLGDPEADASLARGYLSFVLAHADPAAVSEQIDGVTGAPRGVPLLAWSHAELVTAVLLCAELSELPGGGSPELPGGGSPELPGGGLPG